MRHTRTTIAMLAVTVAATAAALTGTAGASTKQAAPSTPVNTARGTEPTVVSTTRARPTAVTLHTARAKVGATTETILVNTKGLPLYFYKPDTATQSMVSGELAALWPPLLASAPTADGAAGKLKVVDTPNGHQVTYNGHFLYTFVEDSSGHVTGQGVENFFVATPGIAAKHTGVTSPPAPARSFSGY